MRRLLPSRVELMIFAALAVILAGVVSHVQPGSHDLGAAALAVPTFIFAAIMGLRRSPQWMAPQDIEADPVDDA